MSEHPIKNSNQTNLEQIIDKYKKILHLLDDTFILKKIKESDSVYETEISWDNENDLWNVLYKENPDIYYIIHELGHVSLAKMCDFQCFAKQMKDNPEVDWIFPMLFNSMVDGFVDYQLSLFPEIYPILREKYLLYFEDFEETKFHMQSNNDYIEVFTWFILWDQIFHGILKVEDSNKYKNQINNLLSLTRLKLQNASGGMDKRRIKEVIKQLDNFNNYKDFTDVHKIMPYFSNVLNATEFWEESKIAKQMKLYFTC